MASKIQTMCTSINVYASACLPVFPPHTVYNTNIKFTHVYILHVVMQVFLWACVCVSVSLCYLEFIFPLMLHLEVLSSCGQFLGSEIWQGFRLETTQGMPRSQRRSNYRKPEQKRVTLKKHGGVRPGESEMIAFSLAELKTAGLSRPYSTVR